MKIWSDSHHSGLYRSIFLLFQDRLGHEVWFPDDSFASYANITHVGTWLSPGFEVCGGVPDKYLNSFGGLTQVCSRDQFMETKWDAVIVSRPESVNVLRPLIEKHPQKSSIKWIGQAGNEGQSFDWRLIPNFLSSDLLSYERAPKDINKIHYLQEVGRQFQADTFTPVNESGLKIINTFINCLTSFNNWRWDKDRSWWNGNCPHCEGPAPIGPIISVNAIWNNMKSHLPEYQVLDYGIGNSQGVIEEKELPKTILSGALTWAFKTYEGMGHSIAQSISMGRLCLVPRRFHRYRTAGQFLIPNLTALESEWRAEDCIQTIREFTSSLAKVNDYSEACFAASKGIFNWAHEAGRVKEFMEKIR